MLHEVIPSPDQCRLIDTPWEVKSDYQGSYIVVTLWKLKSAWWLKIQEPGHWN